MPSRMGSEEFYTGGARIPAARNYTPETLELLRNSTANNLAIQRQQGDIQADAARERGQALIGAIKEVPKMREQNRENQRKQEENERQNRKLLAEEAIARDQASLRQQQLAESKMNMENAQKQSQIMYGDRPGGSLAEQTAQSQIYSTKLQGQTAALQAEAARKANAESTRNNLAVIMKDPLSRNDMAALEAARAQGLKMGLSPTDIQVAEATAKSQLQSGRETANLTYDTSIPGQLANEKIGELDAKISGLSALINEGQAYKKAPAGSAEEDAALQKIKDVLGPEADQLDSRISVDTSGIKTRGQKIDRLVAKVKGDVQREIKVLEARAGGSGSPRVKEQIEILKKNLEDIDRISNAKVNFMTGQKAPQGGTMLTNALRGGGQQQSPTMQAPAGVQLVNDQLKGQKVKGSPYRRLER